MNQTAKIVEEMLLEDTGQHMLDSGGDGNRNWQRNRANPVPFKDQPEVFCTFSIFNSELQIEASINLYHWMVANLEYVPQEQAAFDEYVETQSSYMPWYSLMCEYADEYMYPYVECNTYNETWGLSQVIQYIRNEETDLILLQVHGGADVRGGYTKPRMFRVKSDDFAFNAQLDSVFAGEYYWNYYGYLGEFADDTNCDHIPDILKLPAYSEVQDTDEPYILVRDKHHADLVIARGEYLPISVGNSQFMS